MIEFPKPRTSAPPRLRDKVRVKGQFEATVCGVAIAGGRVLVDLRRAAENIVITHVDEQNIEIVERYQETK